MDNLRDIIKNSQETVRLINRISCDKSVSYKKGVELRKAREVAKNRIWFAKNLLRAMVN